MALISTTSTVLLGGQSKPLIRSPGDVASPALIGGPSELIFDMTTARPGVPGVNDQFERFGESRTWEANYTHPEGFAGVRWQPTWMRADGYYGSWEPAEGEIFRIRRKGTTGQGARTLVITAGPNPAPIPVGDSVVLWEVDGYNGGVRRNAFINLSGYNLPMRAKMTVTACTPSAPWDGEGRRIIEVDAGTELPAIDLTVQPFTDTQRNETWQSMRVRHWSFYVDRSINRMRWPLPWFRDNTLDLVLPNNGYVMLGGLQMRPTWRDWSLDWNDFGASLVEQLWREECEGLAFYFGATNPKRLAVELENEPTRPWENQGGEIGYGQLLADVWYPVARRAWGRERTIGVKSTGFGSIDSLRDDFNWTNPNNDNTFLFAHNYDGQFHMNHAGGHLAIWANIGETDYAADVIATKMTRHGFKGGGFTEFGTSIYEWWQDANGDLIPVPQEERGRRMGRGLTSLTSRGLSQWSWGMVGDWYDNTAIYDDGPNRIQKYFPEMRPYCVRAGRTTT